MDYKYWLYSFNHSTRVDNACLHADNDKVPLSHLTNKPPNIKHLHSWSCRVWIRDNIKHNGKLAIYHRNYYYLGYSSTVTNIIYLDEDTKQIKTSNNYDFNKLFIDLDDPPSNAKILGTYFFSHKVATIEQPSSAPTIIVLDHLFLSLK